MRYLIDGYNLLHALGMAPPPGSAGRLEPARERMLDQLSLRAGEEAGALTVVFDAQQSRGHGDAAKTYHGIHILYSTQGSADDQIEEMIRTEARPAEVTVVSDDRRLRDAARRRRCRVLACVEFYAGLLEQPRRSSAAPPDPPRFPPERLSPQETRAWMKELGFEEEDQDAQP